MRYDICTTTTTLYDGVNFLRAWIFENRSWIQENTFTANPIFIGNWGNVLDAKSTSTAVATRHSTVVVFSKICVHGKQLQLNYWKHDEDNLECCCQRNVAPPSNMMMRIFFSIMMLLTCCLKWKFHKSTKPLAQQLTTKLTKLKLKPTTYKPKPKTSLISWTLLCSKDETVVLGLTWWLINRHRLHELLGLVRPTSTLLMPWWVASPGPRLGPHSITPQLTTPPINFVR